MKFVQKIKLYPVVFYQRLSIYQYSLNIFDFLKTTIWNIFLI